ncbi:hypothetical protein BC936DRAFT_139538, partial [Jimgerdemannia flammicorona]
MHMVILNLFFLSINRDYIAKYQLYRQPIWQCETTGRLNLTYEQALESERIEKERVEDKFPGQLRRRVLEMVQNQTSRLDALVDDTFNYFKDRYVEGEVVNCLWDDGVTYNAEILEIIPPTSAANTAFASDELVAAMMTDQPNGDIVANGKGRSRDSSVTESDDESHGRTNGKQKAEDPMRLDPVSIAVAAVLDHDHLSDQQIGTQYKVQLVDEDGEGIEDCIKVVRRGVLSRDRLAFSKNLMRKFIRECTTKDSYVGAPWLIKGAVAKKYGIDTTLPADLQHARDLAHAKSRRRRGKTTEEREADKRLKAEEMSREKLKRKEDKEKARAEKKKLPPIKYPIEDLDLPAFIEPPAHPRPHSDTILAPRGTETMLMVWAFLSVFAKPLGLSPFTIDEFESAVGYSAGRCPMITETHASLLNVIIRERKTGGPGMVHSVGGTRVAPTVYVLRERAGSEETVGSNDEMVVDMRVEDVARETAGGVVKKAIRLGSEGVKKVGKGWDEKELKIANERKGWEAVLVGCLNELAMPETFLEIDAILDHLVPATASSPVTADDVERAYPHLSVTEKLRILDFLVEIVNGCTVIRDYMEECQETMTDLRKQRAEITREKRKLMNDRAELERREFKAEQEAAGALVNLNLLSVTLDAIADADGISSRGEDEDEKEAGSDEDELVMADSDDDEENDEEEDEEASEEDERPRRSRRKPVGATSRQAKLKQKQREREADERRRAQQHEKQREEARARNQELKAKAEERRRLDEEERALHKKEELVEHSMRRCSTLRFRPLGRDRYHNRYYFFDQVGGGIGHGTGRLYVQGPSEGDMIVMRERGVKKSRVLGEDGEELYQEDVEEDENDRGKGWDEVKERMWKDGFEEEVAVIERWWEEREKKRKVEGMEVDGEEGPVRPVNEGAWWSYYSEPEQVR